VGGSPFSYAVYRLVPRVERGERINVGVVVFSRPLDYLAARTALDLTARFHWLVSPSSTIIQPSAVHTGLCGEPAAELDRLFRELVEPVAA